MRFRSGFVIAVLFAATLTLSAQDNAAQDNAAQDNAAQETAAYGATAQAGSQTTSQTTGQPASQSSGQTDANSSGIAYGAPQSPDDQSSAGATGATITDETLPSDLPITTDAKLLYPSSTNAVIEEGDAIGVFIYGESEFSPTVRVDAKGDVDLPFLHEVQIAGLTIAQAQNHIAALLTHAGIYVDPQVIVTVTAGIASSASLIGMVHAHVPIYGSRRLLDVLAAAGGLTSTSGHTIVISRRGVPNPIVVNLGTNPLLSPGAQTLILPGDVISIEPAGVVYVLGQFARDGVYALSGSEPTTIMQLAARLGDPSFAAKPHELRLIRTTNGRRHFVQIDFENILKGKDPDPILQAGDILYMPTNAFKAAFTNGGLNSALSLVNLALLAYQVTRY